MAQNKSKSLVGRYVLITWEDAWANSGYETLDSIKGSAPYMVKEIGICIRDDKSGITTAKEYMFADDRFRHIHHTPRAMIRKIQVLS